MTKMRSITKLYKTVVYSIYLLLEYSKRFVQPVVEPTVRILHFTVDCKL